MSSNLYLFFDASSSTDALSSALRGTTIPGYSFSTDPMRPTIDAPGERRARTRCAFYAQNYFRIFIADRAIHFFREAALPPELAAGEQHLLSFVLGMAQFRLRRWIITEEGWNDDDQPFVNVVGDGTDAQDLLAERGPVVPNV